MAVSEATAKATAKENAADAEDAEERVERQEAKTQHRDFSTSAASAPPSVEMTVRW